MGLPREIQTLLALVMLVQFVFSICKGHHTNNLMEAIAILYTVKNACDLGWRRLICESDSQVVIRLLNQQQLLLQTRFIICVFIWSQLLSLVFPRNAIVLLIVWPSGLLTICVIGTLLTRLNFCWACPINLITWLILTGFSNALYLNRYASLKQGN